MQAETDVGSPKLALFSLSTTTTFSPMLPVSVLNFLHPLVSLFTSEDYASSQWPFSPFRSHAHHEHESAPLTFELRHLHTVTPSAHVYFSDIAPSSSFHSISHSQDPMIVKQRRITRHRPSSPEAFALSRLRSIRSAENDASLGWEEDEVEAPDVESRETLLVLAKMTSNAYYDGPGENGWYDLGGNWTAVSDSFWPLRVCILHIVVGY